MTVDPLAKLIERLAMRAEDQKLVEQATVSQRRPGGAYFVSTTKGAFWMNSVTDELFRVGSVVWVVQTETGPVILGGVK